MTRYREKKRSRLFSKKIRYEVRKVNAESRPRMKVRNALRFQSAFSESLNHLSIFLISINMMVIHVVLRLVLVLC